MVDRPSTNTGGGERKKERKKERDIRQSLERRGTRWCTWSRYCATSRKVAGSIPDGTIKGKAIPLQAWTGPEGSRRCRFPDFVTVGT